jgi:hypothetical protein
MQQKPIIESKLSKEYKKQNIERNFRVPPKSLPINNLKLHQYE